MELGEGFDPFSSVQPVADWFNPPYGHVETVKALDLDKKNALLGMMMGLMIKLRQKTQVERLWKIFSLYLKETKIWTMSENGF